MLDDDICSTIDGKMQYTQVRLLMYMMAYAVHLIANAVHTSGAPDVLYIVFSTVHLVANAVHPSEDPGS